MAGTRSTEIVRRAAKVLAIAIMRGFDIRATSESASFLLENIQLAN